MTVKAEMEKMIDSFTSQVTKLAQDLARDTLAKAFNPQSPSVQIEISGTSYGVDKTTKKIMKEFAKQSKKAAKKVVAVAKDAKRKADKKIKKATKAARKLTKKESAAIAKANAKAVKKATKRRPKKGKKRNPILLGQATVVSNPATALGHE